MADIVLWFESPGNDPVRVVLDERASLHGLKSRLAEMSLLPNFGNARSLSEYQITSIKSGLLLSDENSPLSSLLRGGDHISVIEDSTVISPERKCVGVSQPFTSITTSQEVGPLEEDHGRNPVGKSPPVDSTLFSIAAINPIFPDFETEYTVLAIFVKYAGVGQILGRRTLPATSERPIFKKESSFLVCAKNGRFRWVKTESSLRFGPHLRNRDWENGIRKLNRYCIQKKIGESKNMIYPIRPFSITAINMEGFDPIKSYPVLAIDVDQYFQERPVAESEQTEEVEELEPSGPDQPTSMAFFLVGDEGGEFAWIAEDECRLASF